MFVGLKSIGVVAQTVISIPSGTAKCSVGTMRGGSAGFALGSVAAGVTSGTAGGGGASAFGAWAVAAIERASTPAKARGRFRFMESTGATSRARRKRPSHRNLRQDEAPPPVCILQFALFTFQFRLAA